MFKPVDEVLANSDDYWTHESQMVDWFDYSRKDRAEATAAVEAAKYERDMQRFLKDNPKHLIQHLGGGHGRWVLPSFKLGKEFVADFIVGERDSFGHTWQLVELESPSVKMFTKAGNPSKYLTHAIRQIHDWQNWLHENRDYAARKTEEGGLGLLDITGDCDGIIILGRWRDLTPQANKLRRHMMRTQKIQIRTYDFFCESGSCGISDAYEHSQRKR